MGIRVHSQIATIVLARSHTWPRMVIVGVKIKHREAVHALIQTFSLSPVLTFRGSTLLDFSYLDLRSLVTSSYHNFLLPNSVCIFMKFFSYVQLAVVPV